MEINYKLIPNFDKNLLNWLKQFEGLSEQPEKIKADNTITYGYGYTLIRNNGQRKWTIYQHLNADLEKIDLTLTKDQKKILQDVADSLNKGDGATENHKKLINSFRESLDQPDLTEEKAEKLFYAEWEHQKTALKNRFVSKLGKEKGSTLFEDLFDESTTNGKREMLAIVSLFYNAQALVGGGLLTALYKGNRAEAWFEIRYGHADQLHKRRYAEAALFGLYDDPSKTPEKEEALAVYRMFTKHKLDKNIPTDNMIDYEKKYEGLIPGANADLSSAGFASQVVKTLKEELTPAAKTLMDEYVKDEYGISRDFNPFNIQVASENLPVLFGEETDALTGSNADLLIGSDDEDNFLVGKGGNDLLLGLAGDDILDGGDGNDILVGGVGHDAMDGGDGDDIFFVSGKEDAFDIFVGDAGKDIIKGSAEDDIIRVNQLSAFTSIEEIDGGSGNNSIAGTQEADTIDLSLTEIKNIEQIDGGGGNDTLIGSSKVDHILGGKGDDLIQGGKGDDLLEGGEGIDIYIVNSGDGHDTIIDTGINIIQYNGVRILGCFEQDPDTGSYVLKGLNFDISLSFHSPGQLELDANTSITFADFISAEDFATGDYGFFLLDATDSPTTVIAGTDNDDYLDDSSALPRKVEGLYGNDMLWGSVEDDELDGGAGNDLIYASGGADRIEAGDGDDLISGIDGGSVVNGGDGNDFIMSRDNPTVGAGSNDDSFVHTYFEYLKIPSQSSLITADVVWTDVNNNWRFETRGELNLNKDGYVARGFSIAEEKHVSGNSVLGDGWTYDINIIQSPKTAYTFVKYIHPTEAPDGIYQDIVWGRSPVESVTQGFVAAGAAGDDLIYGSQMADSLSGGTENDSLFAGGGNDVVDGGSGDDALGGGPGDDVLLGDDGNDMLFGETGADTLYGDAGDDLLYGGSQAAALAAFDGDDIIDGGAGNDYLAGQEGDDSLLGGVGSDQLYGGDGNDTLNGGAGADYLSGGAGDDLYTFKLGDGLVEISYVDGIVDREGTNSLWFDASVSLTTLKVHSISGTTLQLQYGTKNYLLIADGVLGAISDIRIGAQYLSLSELLNSTWTSPLTVTGDAEDNTVNGGGGADNLTGGAGDDVLSGGDGNDVYTFARGDDHDLIVDSGGDDRLRFGAGLTAADLIFRRAGDDVMIGLKEGDTEWSFLEDHIVLTNWYLDAARIENFVFDDGFSLRIAGILSKLADAETIDAAIYGSTDHDNLRGSDRTDILFGGNGNDVLTGLAGNDLLYGEAGKDILAGNSGDDTLIGGTGNDTYRFNVGDGEDTVWDYNPGGVNSDKILFGAGIVADDLRLFRMNDDLYLQIQDGEDALTIENWFTSDAYVIERFVFDDGTVLSAAQLEALGIVLTGDEDDNTLVGGDGSDTVSGEGGADSLYGNGGDDLLFGGDGDDRLYGGAGNDTLEGGADNDSLEGGVGSDTYLFGFGDGQDTISDRDAAVDQTDTIAFGAGVTVETLQVSQVGKDLFIQIENGTETLTIEDWFLSRDYVIEQFVFEDGTVLIADQLELYGITLVGDDEDNVLNGGSGNDSLYGKGGKDILRGSNGNDSLFGGDGDDQLNGGADNDTLEGGAGNDTLEGLKGEDILCGGAGNDFLYGGYGDDRYLFGVGDGQDILEDYDPQKDDCDTVVFGEGLMPQDIEWIKSEHDLKLVIRSSGDSLTIQEWFPEQEWWLPVDWNGRQVEGFEFSDGTIWSRTDIEIIAGYTTYGTEGDDTLYAIDFDKEAFPYPLTRGTLYGGGGSDYLCGGCGDDVLWGEDGDDTLYGFRGSNTLYGGNGNDTLRGGYDNDIFDGGPGDDTLEGGALEGSSGNDRFLFGIGSGQDTLKDYDPFVGNMDTVVFGEGLTPVDIELVKAGNNLKIVLKNAVDTLTIQGWFDAKKASSYQIEQFEFGDGTVWSSADIEAVGYGIYGGSGNDTNLQGSGGRDLLYGLDGDDTLYGNGGNDELYGDTGADVLYGGGGNDLLSGGEGNDKLYGDAGSDTLDGGAGNDTLEGGTGNDVYRFGLGSGQDSLKDYDTAAGNLDTVVFGEGLTPDDIDWVKAGTSLKIVLKNSADTLTIQGWFDAKSPSAYQIERFAFADGTVWSKADLEAVGYAVYGGSVNDANLQGTGASDRIFGYGGNDTLYGNGGNDELYGDTGTDTLYGGGGSDLLSGGEGNDKLYGDAGSDTLAGGAGNDTLEGGTGNDVYRFGLGGGQDTLKDYDTTAGNLDTVVFGEGLTPDDIDWVKAGTSLKIVLKNAADTLTIQGWFDAKNASRYQIERFAFADGTVWTKADLEAVGYGIYGGSGNNTLQGTGAYDRIFGYGGADTLYGNGGNDELYGDTGADTLYGGGGHDLLSGGDGNDKLYGQAGSDTLDGGAGNDTLEGGTGNDRYLFGLGSGKDKVTENDATVGNEDRVLFRSDPLDLIFSKSGSGLKIELADTNDSLTINNWYSGSRYQTEIFETSDGNQLLNTQVNQLIQAMASFGAQSGLSWEQAVQDRPDDVQAILAVYWKPAA